MFARNGVYNDCAFDIRAAEQPDGFVLHLADPEGDAVRNVFRRRTGTAPGLPRDLPYPAEYCR